MLVVNQKNVRTQSAVTRPGRLLPQELGAPSIAQTTDLVEQCSILEMLIAKNAHQTIEIYYIKQIKARKYESSRYSASQKHHMLFPTDA